MLLVCILVTAVYYKDRIYPGVNVCGQKLGGWKKEQFETYLNSKSSAFAEIDLRMGVNEWKISVRDINFQPNIAETITNARPGKKELTVSYIYDEAKIREIVASISAQINIPAQEPGIIKEGNPAIINIFPGENGQQLAETRLLRKIEENLACLATEKIDIPVVEIKPKLSSDQLEIAKQKAEGVLGKELEIKLDEENQVWKLTDDVFLTWIDLRSGGWKTPEISKWVEDLAKAADKPAQNASLRFLDNGKVEEFKPAKNGIKVDTEATNKLIITALDNLSKTNDRQTILIATGKIEPDITTEKANNLGIKELIGKGESWFNGSITNRIYNLKKASSTINGTLVPPGEMFSFNHIVGEISGDTGYKQAYIIKEGKTILGDGGGVCQVSSTLFRAVLNAGLPIESRTAHAYRVSYYEVNYQPGFDATVFQPAPDFKFVNDTAGYILIQMVYDENKKYLAFEIYGTGDGRKVEISKARIWDVISPPPDLYIDDPNMPLGKIVQTEHAAKGSKAAFDWKVTRGDEILQERTFYSNYRPWQGVYLRGTKPV